MSSRMQLLFVINSLVWMVLAGCLIVVVLTVPALASNQGRNIAIAVVASLVVSPVISWVISGKIQKIM